VRGNARAPGDDSPPAKGFRVTRPTARPLLG
jgi:hypothetical protein